LGLLPFNARTTLIVAKGGGCKYQIEGSKNRKIRQKELEYNMSVIRKNKEAVENKECKGVI